MAVLPPKPLANAQERTTTIPGAVLAGVGGAALITGVALIAVDAVRRKKQAKTAVAPALAPGFAGLSLRGRF